MKTCVRITGFRGAIETDLENGKIVNTYQSQTTGRFITGVYLRDNELIPLMERETGSERTAIKNHAEAVSRYAKAAQK